MAAYRMTPARRAALEKAQAASARKRRKGSSKSRTSRLANRKTLALVAVGGFTAHTLASKAMADPVEQMIVDRHVAIAQTHHDRLNALRFSVFPTTALTSLPFNPDAARREAIAILRKRKKRKT